MTDETASLLGSASGPLPDRSTTAGVDQFLLGDPGPYISCTTQDTDGASVAHAGILDVLVIDDDVEDRMFVGEALRAHVNLRFADTLEAGVSEASEHHCDAVLLDLCLPGRSGLESLVAFRRDHPDLPVVVFTGMYDDSLGVEALREGADDYLGKDQLDGASLARTIRFAVERSLLRAELEKVTLLDEKTGMRNHRGLERHGTAAIQRALRKLEPLAVLSLSFVGEATEETDASLDDKQLVRVARMLEATLRREDIVGRVGATTFCAILVGHPNPGGAAARLGGTIDRHNKRHTRPLMLQLGMVELDHRQPATFDELFKAAQAQLASDEAAQSQPTASDDAQ